MKQRNFQRVGILLLLLTGNVHSLSVAWQGTGNMSQSNMTEVQTVISNNPITDSTSLMSYEDKAQAISTALNTLWDPAWNVFIVKSEICYNTILYGYAFREHWMWINGITLDTTYWLTYIIWKDYNCHNWRKTGEL